MSSERFSPAELLTDEAILSEAGRRMSLNADLLERLGGAVDNRTYDIFLFLWKYGPATWEQMAAVFPKATLQRALNLLELNRVIVKRSFSYSVSR